MYSLYQQVKEATIEEFNAQQLILAKQAAKGIEGFFEHYNRELVFLSGIEEIIVLNERGRELLEIYYRRNASRIKAITRMDADGVISYTVPFNPEAIGRNITYQEHIKLLFKTHQPVISDVFQAVQGYQAVAFHIPVYQDGRFAGSMAVLIPFENIASEYLKNIHIAKSGYAWMLSEGGIELYCPVPGHVGTSVFETSGKFPSVISIARKMMAGESGAGQYVYDKIKGDTVVPITKRAVYFPVRLGNTYWSIIVATPEEEVLATMKGFTARWMSVFILLAAVSMIFLFYIFKTRTIIKESRQKAIAEEELKKSEFRYRTILENIEEGYCEFDLKGKITFFNKPLLRIIGYKSDELIGMDLRTIVGPENTKQMSEIFEEVLLADAPREMLDFEFIRRDGEKRMMEVTISPKRDLHGEIIGVFTVARDVTEKQRTRELVIQTEKMMSVGGLAAGMAHEINNPIAGIMQGAQNVLRRLSPELKANRRAAEKTGIDLGRLEKYLEERKIISTIHAIREAGDRAAKIVLNILRFSRPAELEKTEIDPAELLDEAVVLAENDFDLKKMYDFQKIEIIKKYEKGTVKVFCNETEIKQVVLNLLRNASQALREKASQSTPCIILKVDDRHDHVVIEVEDNGPGIKEDVRKRIFEPFFTTKPVGQGTGLGLSVSYMIITNNHNGTMEVDSKPGSGTRFIISLPVEKITNSSA